MANLSPAPKLQFFDANGNLLVGGKLYSYAAGTTTPLATFTDSTESSSNPNPTFLDSRGEANVWLGSAQYKLKLTTSTDVEIWTVDNIGGGVTLNQLAAPGGAALIGNTPTGGLVATTVQAAINELDTEKVSSAALAASNGSSLVGFIQTATGAAARTAQSKMRDVVSITDFGVVANNTDQTAAIVAALTGLGASWEGVILIPGNVRFDFNQVIPVVPDKAIVQFTNTMQSGVGYRQQLTGIISNPPDANTDTAFSIIDPHYPDLMLNNSRTAGTTSAAAGLSGYSWARGFFENGTKGPRFQWQANFRKSVVRTSEYGGAGVGCFEFRTRSPERAGDYEIWFNGIVVQISDFILAPNGIFYKALTAGTSTVAPTATSGTQTVGGVTWEYQGGEWVNFRVAFYVDELGRLGTVPVPAGATHLWQQNPEDPEDFIVRYEASGNNKDIVQRFLATNVSGVQADTVRHEYTSTNGYRLLDDSGSRVLFRAFTQRGFQLAQYGLLTVAATDGDTTPSVNSVGQLRLINSSPTSITTFDDSLPNQEFSAYFTNGNTTLVHSSALRLKGAVNVTPAADSIMTFTREPSASAYWVEKSRNF